VHAASLPIERDPSGCGRALEGALQALHALWQDDHWVGTLSSSALATAMSITDLHTVGPERYRARIERGRAWLLLTQASDGGWGDAMVDESNINATSLALAALALTSRSPSAVPRSARERLERFGGFEAVGDPARCTLSGPCRTVSALAGLMDWRRIKRLRPEVVLLPHRWRRTISTTFPAYLSISLLHSTRAPHPLNRLPTYQLARRTALSWLRNAQGPNGSFEESAFLTSVIVTCLVAAGLGDLPWLQPAIEFVLASQREDGSWPIDRDLETFDTDLAVLALSEADALDDSARQRVRRWLLQRQFSEECFATGAIPGGWAWAMPAGWPDADDTAYTLVALRRLGVPAETPALQRGSDWLAWLQDGGGSWSTFVRGSRMPFDHDCPYITGHALSALAATNRLGRDPKLLSRALGYLARAQRADGSFASIWFRDATAGTASVVEGLSGAGLRDHPIVRRGREALLGQQNEDGGWAGHRGQPSTAEETSWALLALLAGGPPPAGDVAAIQRGLDWLVRHQRPDGTWQPAPIGLYYSAMWYSDSMYALAWPAQALARARQSLATLA
jgi:squalene-hopene/tetraprenyl-beta-curcumene cyclase